MNRFSKTAGMALLMTAALCAHAQSTTPRTRDEVRSELAEAVRNGTILQGEIGLAPRDLYPENNPPLPQAPGRSRASVQAELAEARRTGDILAPGESGLPLKETFPSLYSLRAHPVYAGAATERDVHCRACSDGSAPWPGGAPQN